MQSWCFYSHFFKVTEVCPSRTLILDLHVAGADPGGGGGIPKLHIEGKKCRGHARKNATF